MKWYKWLSLASIVLVLLALGLSVWARVAYGKRQLVNHKRVTITLPFSVDNEANRLIPMGETIEHPNSPGGHPGLDFGWERSVPLIAVGDGTITAITDALDLGDPVKYVTLRMGEYAATYKELSSVNVIKGQKVKQGELIGTPHCLDYGDHTGCQLHWEFSYASFLAHFSGAPDRLCPLTYFDSSALVRITAVWDIVPANDKFKKEFPHICSNVFYEHNE